MHVAFYTSMDLQNFSLFGFVHVTDGYATATGLSMAYTGNPIHSLWRNTILAAVFVDNLAATYYLY